MSDNRLKSFVERIAKLHEDRKAIAEDITEVVKEAAGVGYIPKTLRKVVARYLADPAKLAEDDALLETYEAALGRVGKALKAVREGSTWQEASEATGVPRATLARAEAVSKRREMIPEEKGEEAEASTPGAALPLERVESQATTEHSTDAPKPEDGGDGITESCGERAGTRSPNQSGVETARYDGDARNQANPAVVGPPARFDSGPHDADAVCVHCAGKRVIWCHGGKSGETGEWVDGYENPCPFCADESPAPPSVGAVASESERVAPPYPDDDDLTIPSYLRGPSPANRRVA